MPSALLVQAPHALGELDDALLVEAVGHGQRLGVVRDGDVLVAQGAGGFGHLLERGAAVARDRVHVQIAADLGQFDQARQAALGGGLDLALVLAQLRRNPGQAESLVDALPRSRRRSGRRLQSGKGRTR